MSKNKGKLLGVAGADFTERIWHDVTTAYIQSAYRLDDDAEIDRGHWLHIGYDTVVDDLNNTGWGEYRLGSIMTPHSKLIAYEDWGKVIGFDFDANADEAEMHSAHTLYGVVPEQIRDEFRVRTAEYLKGLGVARDIVGY